MPESTDLSIQILSAPFVVSANLIVSDQGDVLSISAKRPGIKARSKASVNHVELLSLNIPI